MKLAKKLLIGTLIMSMVALGGCGKKEEVSTETSAVETVKPSESPEITPSATQGETEKVKEELKNEVKDDVENASKDATKEDAAASDELPIDKPQYANLEELEGESYRTKIPEGWKKGGDTTVSANVEAYNIISNSKLNSEIIITEQALDGADTIDMGAYMKDHKKMYNEQSESTGVYVTTAGDRELDAVKVGFMKCDIKITEQMVKNAITVGTVTQEEVDAAGGMDSYITKQNTTQLQIYVPNRSCIITISTRLEGDHVEEIEKAAFELANIMYLK